MSRKESMLAMLRREQAEITRKMMALERVPDEDTYPHETMIKVVTDRGQTYLLLKIVIDGGRGASGAPVLEARWYYTGSIPRRMTSDPRWLTWNEVQTWLGQVDCDSWEVLVVNSEVPLNTDKGD